MNDKAVPSLDLVGKCIDKVAFILTCPTNLHYLFSKEIPSFST